VSGGPTELSGVALSSDPAGDRFVRIRIFDQALGLSAALFRLPGKKSGQSAPPDLFDDLECQLNPLRSGSSIPFVAEYQKARSYRELARNPSHFLSASEIARFYLNNGSHLLDPQPRLELLRTALDSFSRTLVPKVVLLKLYFCFARDEGLPVRESWLSCLPQVLTEETRRALTRPVCEIGLDANRIEELVESIKLWMNAETELRVE
jgi:hypothetical protein